MRLHMLVWVYTCQKYHIVGNQMSRCNYVFTPHHTPPTHPHPMKSVTYNKIGHWWNIVFSGLRFDLVAVFALTYNSSWVQWHLLCLTNLGRKIISTPFRFPQNNLFICLEIFALKSIGQHASGFTVRPYAHQSMSQSINQSINSRSVRHSVKQPVRPYVRQSVWPSISQSDSQSIKKSVSQSINSFFRLSDFQSVSLSISSWSTCIYIKGRNAVLWVLTGGGVSWVLLLHCLAQARYSKNQYLKMLPIVR